MKELFPFLIFILSLEPFTAFARVYTPEEMNAGVEDIRNRLSQDECESLSYYFGDFYRCINDRLRNKVSRTSCLNLPTRDGFRKYEESEIADMISNIDSSLAKVPRLPEDIILFRGVDLSYRGGQPYSISIATHLCLAIGVDSMKRKFCFQEIKNTKSCKRENPNI